MRLRAEGGILRPPGADSSKEEEPFFDDFGGYDVLDEGSRAPERPGGGEGAELAIVAKSADVSGGIETAPKDGLPGQEGDDDDDIEISEVSDAEVEEFLMELEKTARVDKGPEGGFPVDPWAPKVSDFSVFEDIKAAPQRRLLYERGMPNTNMMITLKDRMKMMSEYAHEGNWKRARYIMKGMWRRRQLRVPLGRIMWNLMIKAHMRANRPLAAESWINDMLTRVYQPDHYSYNTLLQGYARRGDIHKVSYWMKRMRGRGVPPDLYTYTAQVMAHSTAEDLDGAERALKAMEADLGTQNVNAVPYNAVLKLCAQEGDVERAERWISHMKKAYVKPDKVTHLYMLKVYAKDKDSTGAGAVLEEMQRGRVRPDRAHFHALMTAHAHSSDLEGAEAWMRVMDDQGFNADVFSYNIILSSLASIGDVAGCEAFLNRMQVEGIQPDIYSFGSMIQASAKSGDVDSALGWIMTAEELGLEADLRCYNQALKACEVAGNSSMAELFGRRILRHSLDLDANSYGALLGAFAKDGNPAAAEFWIDHMQRSARWRYGEFSQGQIGFAYSQVLAAYVRVGNLEAAEAWLSQMLGEGVEPNARAYMELIRGHLDEGRPAEAQKWCTRMSSWSNHKVPEELLQLCQGGGQPILEDVTG